MTRTIAYNKNFTAIALVRNQTDCTLLNILHQRDVHYILKTRAHVELGLRLQHLGGYTYLAHGSGIDAPGRNIGF